MLLNGYHRLFVGTTEGMIFIDALLIPAPVGEASTLPLCHVSRELFSASSTRLHQQTLRTALQTHPADPILCWLQASIFLEDAKSVSAACSELGKRLVCRPSGSLQDTAGSGRKRKRGYHEGGVVPVSRSMLSTDLTEQV